MLIHPEKTHVTWWHHSTKTFRNRLKSLVTWSRIHCTEKRMLRTKEALFTENCCKLKRVSPLKLRWKSLIEESTKIIKWDFPFLGIFITCKQFQDKWSRITTILITLEKILLFVVREISIMRLCIKLFKNTFLYQNKRLNRPNFSNQHLSQVFLLWKAS